MNVVKLLLSLIIALGAPLCAAAEGPSQSTPEGLQLAVREERVAPGGTTDLQWEIVPDGESSVSIVLGVILPDGGILYYEGPREGFNDLEDIGLANPLVTDFPFNTRMRGSLEISIPADWPAGTYQFIAAVLEGKTVIEFIYSNSFQIK